MSSKPTQFFGYIKDPNNQIKNIRYLKYFSRELSKQN